MAEEYFKIEKKISIAVIQAMIMQEALNEATKDFRPESVRTREKITNLYIKSDDAISKARELEDSGDALKSKIQQLTAESLRLKARAAEIDWRVKQLKEKL
jgi:uncharacterized protein (DUF3084 family)